ncbi:MAG: right-handed parallel beta-helix repeat-containing protein, partial [Tepidiforma sp.]
MRRLAAGLALLVVLLPVVRGSIPAAADDPGVLYVTSTTDGPGTCPHPSSCTLRTAIAVVNSGSAATTTIRFDPAVFPPGSETVIAVGSAPLPALTRPGAAVDGAGAGVVLRGGSASLSTPQDGLRLGGAGTSVRGLTFEGFTGACVVAEGDGATVGGAAGNAFRGCGVAVRVSGTAVSVTGNEVAGPAEGERAGTGVIVTASGAVIGGAGAAANRFTGLERGIRVAGGAGGVNGTRIEGNEFDDIAEACVALEPGSGGTLVSANSFHRCGTGISVPAGDELPVSS